MSATDPAIGALLAGGPPDEPWEAEDPWAERPPEPAAGPPLEFLTVAELRLAVAKRGDPRWLIRRLWPAGAYGVLAAEAKAGKTWMAVDLVLAVASGNPWMGIVPIDDPGPVLVFAGEGGKRNILRRLDAVAAFHGVNPDSRPITVCDRVPRLTLTQHLALVTSRIEEFQPRLVVLDPLYLAARGANAAALYEMGAVLEQLQHLCEPTDTGLVVVTHFNRRQGTGAGRITGAGPTEWGRVLLTCTVRSSHTDLDQRSRQVVEMGVTGGEVPDQTLRFCREVWADDPDDLGSALHYTVSPAEAGEPEGDTELPPAARRVLAVLATAAKPLTVREIGDELARAGRPLQKRTIQSALVTLDGQVDSIEVDRRGTYAWRLAAPGQEQPPSPERLI